VKNWKTIGNSTEVKAIYDGDSLRSIYENILGPSYKSFPECTWIRAKGPKEATVVHVDYYYFRNHTKIISQNYNNKLLPNSSCTSSTSNFNPGPAAAASTLSRSAAVTAMAVDGIDGDLEKCKICDSGDNADKLLLCDLCDDGYHIDCLTPKLKQLEDKDWHCNSCADAYLPFYTCWISLVTILCTSTSNSNSNSTSTANTIQLKHPNSIV